MFVKFRSDDNQKFVVSLIPRGNRVFTEGDMAVYPAHGGGVIKAIETKYKGYRFRSRREARWAVFFDKLNVVYEYEPEGFDLDGLWYLPDL